MAEFQKAINLIRKINKEKIEYNDENDLLIKHAEQEYRDFYIRLSIRHYNDYVRKFKENTLFNVFTKWRHSTA